MTNESLMPEGIEVIPAAGPEGSAVFLMFDEIFPNGQAWQSKAMTVHEAGELAYQILQAIPDAIAAQHSFDEAAAQGRA